MTIEQNQAEPTAETTVRDAKMFINGEHVDALDGQTFEVTNPATGKVFARVPLGGKADVDRAVEAAQKAFDGGYGKWSAAKRGRTLQKFADLVKKANEELAQIDRENVGKPIAAPGRVIRGEPRARVLRRRREQAFRRDDPDLPPGLRLHAARADRRSGHDRALELPPEHGRVEAWAGPRHG